MNAKIKYHVVSFQYHLEDWEASLVDLPLIEYGSSAMEVFTDPAFGESGKGSDCALLVASWYMGEMHIIQLTAGKCTVCKVCTLIENKPCRFPDKAISSLEAYCMNVSILAKLCHMNYINGQNTVTYFGAFLFI